MDDVTGLGTPQARSSVRSARSRTNGARGPILARMGLWLAWLSPIYATMCTAGTYTRRCAPQAPAAARRAHCAPHHVVAGSDRPFIWRSLGGYMALPWGLYGFPWKFRRARTREMAEGGGDRTFRWRRRGRNDDARYWPRDSSPPRHSVWRRSNATNVCDTCRGLPSRLGVDGHCCVGGLCEDVDIPRGKR